MEVGEYHDFKNDEEVDEVGVCKGADKIGVSDTQIDSIQYLNFAKK